MTKPKETADGGEVNRKEVVVVTAGEVEEGGQRAGAEWGMGWVGGQGYPNKHGKSFVVPSDLRGNR